MNRLGNIWTSTFIHPSLKEQMNIQWIILDSQGREPKALVVLDNGARVVVELKDLKIKE